MLQPFYEKNRDLLVNINGELIHRDQAGISPFDSSVQNGDAVWEGLRLYNGRIFKLIEHLDRLTTRPMRWPMPRSRPTSASSRSCSAPWPPTR